MSFNYSKLPCSIEFNELLHWLFHWEEKEVQRIEKARLHDMMAYIITRIIKWLIVYYVMQFQIYKMDPETHWKLVKFDIFYIWLSTELLNYAHGPLGFGFFLIFVLFCLRNLELCIWSFLELSQIIGVFPINLYFWELLFCLWIHWLSMPVGYPVVLLGYKGNRDKIIRYKLVRQQSKRTGRKQQASSMSMGSKAMVWMSSFLQQRFLCWTCCAADEAALETGCESRPGQVWSLQWPRLQLWTLHWLCGSAEISIGII